jgi:hypothetical protein
MRVSDHTLTDWNDIHQFCQDGWVYRGQRDQAWDLLTSLDRCCQREAIDAADRPMVETLLIREFRRSYHLYSNHVPPSDATLEWLALMQHHGAPTRVLDFTYSLYTAAYFALETSNADSAVWAVNGTWALNESAEMMTRSSKPSDEVSRLTEHPFYESRERVIETLFQSPPFVPVACLLNPFRLNERLRTQKGVFLLQGAVDRTFPENLAAMPDYGQPDRVIKIVIPKHIRRQAIRALHDMNITRTTLFPGLDGFAQSLNVYHRAFGY